MRAWACTGCARAVAGCACTCTRRALKWENVVVSTHHPVTANCLLSAWGMGVSCTLRDLVNLPEPCPITHPVTADIRQRGLFLPPLVTPSCQPRRPPLFPRFLPHAHKSRYAPRDSRPQTCHAAALLFNTYVCMDYTCSWGPKPHLEQGTLHLMLGAATYRVLFPLVPLIFPRVVILTHNMMLMGHAPWIAWRSASGGPCVYVTWTEEERPAVSHANARANELHLPS